MRKGFSLVELTIAVVILAVAIYGTLMILGGMSRQSTDAERQTLALEYARTTMEYILSKKFDGKAPPMANFINCLDASGALGFDGVESDSNFDDVDDLNGSISEDIPGRPLFGQGFNADILVAYVTPQTSGYTSWISSAPQTCFKRIDLKVKDARTGVVLTHVKALAAPFK